MFDAIRRQGLSLYFGPPDIRELSRPLYGVVCWPGGLRLPLSHRIQHSMREDGQLIMRRVPPRTAVLALFCRLSVF